LADEPKAKVAAAADASFLIGLCVIDQVSLLGEMFERVYVAPAVWDEVVVRGQGRPGAEQIESSSFITRQVVQNRQAIVMLQLFLGPGERETLALAQELSCPLVLMDDLRARRVANQAGMHTLGGWLIRSAPFWRLSDLMVFVSARLSWKRCCGRLGKANLCGRDERHNGD
jgi:predicted nucleic acid-binding protein